MLDVNAQLGCEMTLDISFILDIHEAKVHVHLAKHSKERIVMLRGADPVTMG